MVEQAAPTGAQPDVAATSAQPVAGSRGSALAQVDAMLARGNATPPDIAKVIDQHRNQRAAILEHLQRTRGNAFVQQVIAAGNKTAAPTDAAVDPAAADEAYLLRYPHFRDSMAKLNAQGRAEQIDAMKHRGVMDWTVEKTEAAKETVGSWYAWLRGVKQTQYTDKSVAMPPLAMYDDVDHAIAAADAAYQAHDATLLRQRVALVSKAAMATSQRTGEYYDRVASGAQTALDVTETTALTAGTIAGFAAGGPVGGAAAAGLLKADIEGAEEHGRGEQLDWKKIGFSGVKEAGSTLVFALVAGPLGEKVFQPALGRVLGPTLTKALGPAAAASVDRYVAGFLAGVGTQGLMTAVELELERMHSGVKMSEGEFVEAVVGAMVRGGVQQLFMDAITHGAIKVAGAVKGGGAAPEAKPDAKVDAKPDAEAKAERPATPPPAAAAASDKITDPALETLGGQVKAQMQDGTSDADQLASVQSNLIGWAQTMLGVKGIDQPTQAQTDQTVFELDKAIKSGKWKEFQATAKKPMIPVKDNVNDRLGNIFGEKHVFTPEELTTDNLKLDDTTRARLEGGYMSGTTGMVEAASFIDAPSRSEGDFSHAYGADAWKGYSRAQTYLESIPKGKFVSSLNVDTITKVNELIYAQDPGVKAAMLRTVAMVGRGGQWDVGGQIREGRQFARPEHYSAEEMGNLREAGVSVDQVTHNEDGGGQAMLEYPKPEEIKPTLEKLIAKLKDDLSPSPTNPEATKVDPITAAADFQRHLVALHAFGDSNGRTSRILMNRILSDYDLPPAILADQNRDISASPAAWRDEVAKGVGRSHEFLAGTTSLGEVNRKDSYMLGAQVQVDDANAIVGKPVVMGGHRFELGNDGLLYDPTGRPYMVDNNELVPMAQLEHYMMSRRIIQMGQTDGSAKLTASTQSTRELFEKVLADPAAGASVKIRDDAAARKADASYKMAPDPAVAKMLTELQRPVGSRSGGDVQGRVRERHADVVADQQVHADRSRALVPREGPARHRPGRVRRAGSPASREVLRRREGRGSRSRRTRRACPPTTRTGSTTATRS